MVLAWDKQAGNTNYPQYSTNDIFKMPESATAFWDYQGGKSGIAYANGDNSDCIPLDVNVLAINEHVSSSLRVYPNPTTGELRITN
jgi:hypothetical protein